MNDNDTPVMQEMDGLISPPQETRLEMRETVVTKETTTVTEVVSVVEEAASTANTDESPSQRGTEFSSDIDWDAIVCATGHDPMCPHRSGNDIAPCLCKFITHVRADQQRRDNNSDEITDALTEAYDKGWSTGREAGWEEVLELASAIIAEKYGDENAILWLTEEAKQKYQEANATVINFPVDNLEDITEAAETVDVADGEKVAASL